jgi:hypothetical protein
MRQFHPASRLGVLALVDLTMFYLWRVTLLLPREARLALKVIPSGLTGGAA